jgi:transposase
MSKSAKSSTGPPNLVSDERLALVRLARRHVRDGGTAAAFAKTHGLSRTTVIGWCKDHDGPLGRPRKLETFNETKILECMSADQSPHTWKTIQNLVRKQAGERMERRSVFRLMEKWGLSVEPTPKNGIRAITANEWIQPAVSLHHGHKPARMTIWRLLSGRGMECFMLTPDDSGATAERVGAAMVKRLRGRNRRVQTNHPGLAKVLRETLPKWEVTLY